MDFMHRKVTNLRSKSLLVGIFSRPEIGHACSLSDANDCYIEQGLHFTMKNTFHRGSFPRAGNASK